MTELQSFDELYPGKYLKAGMFHGQPVTYTIKEIARDELMNDANEPEEKIVLSFEEVPLQHILPKINAVCLKAMFGPSVPAWIGKRVTWYATNAIMPYPKRKDEPCIRVFGSPEITSEIRCEWRPPRRKNTIIQTLKPTESEVVAKAKAAILSGSVPPDKARARISELAQSGAITAAEAEALGRLIVAPEPEQPAPATPEPEPPAAEQPEPIDAERARILKFIEPLSAAKRLAIKTAMYEQFPETKGKSFHEAINTPEIAAFVRQSIKES
jgi:hypothetical protein